MKCVKCYHLELYYDKEEGMKSRCLKHNKINDFGCDDFMEIDI